MEVLVVVACAGRVALDDKLSKLSEPHKREIVRLALTIFYENMFYMNHNEYIQVRENPGNRDVILLITNACNLNCKYCYERYKNNNSMSEEICKQVLLKEFYSASPQTSHISITYLGGEPLLNFSLVKNISEWLWGLKLPLPYTIELRTNGTLLNASMKEWFFRNRHRIRLGLSLDGLNATQKINRTDKYIDYRFFTNNWPDQRVKIVLFKESLHLFAETIKEMFDQKIPFNVDIGCGIEWSREDAVVFEEQLSQLVPYYINDVCEARASGIFPFSVENFFKHSFTEYPFCLRNSNNVSYASDGQCYQCYMLSPLVLGNAKAQWIRQNHERFTSLPIMNECSHCPLFDVCKSCPALNLQVRGDLNEHAPLYTTCKMIKVQARACATLFLRHIQSITKKGVKINKIIFDGVEKSEWLLKAIPEARFL